MRVLLYRCCRLALALAVFPAAARAQNGATSNTPVAPTAVPREISSASLEETEGNITALVPKLLEARQYSKQPFDAAMSAKFLDRYLDTLDHWHLYFLESDLRQFDAYSNVLQTLSTRQHDFSPAMVIFSRFIERAAERTEFATNLLRTEAFEFTNQERFIPNRHDLPNPTNLDQAHHLWRQELRLEYLDEKLKAPNMAISGPASFDAQSNVMILLPIEYTNSASAKSTNSVTNRTVVSLLPDKFTDQDRHAFGTISPNGSNVVVRLHISPGETLRKVTNDFYSPDGKRLGGIHFVHLADTNSDTNHPAAEGATPTNHLKGVVELDRKDTNEIVRTLEKRYTGLLKNYNDLTNDDYVLEEYLTALAHTYDPHSDYMGHASTENFNISMRLSLSGIGAVLRQEDGECKVGDLVPEGPAAKSGRITNDDIITAVAQKDQEPVTVTGMPLLKVVGMIRGPKGTPVTLTITKAHPADPSSRKDTFTLVRDVIKLEDQTAKAKLYENTNTATPARIAVIDLSSFYANNDPDPPGEPPQEHVSTSKDVARLLTRLKKENVDGVILDLRRNGGGFLEEAIRLTGLFVSGRVPVVQTKEPDEAPGQPGKIDVDSTPRAPALYDGPLMLLTSRLSASASEIVAGALQDYGRALIVGDKSTFGKGTVQSVFAMSNLMIYQHLPYSYDPGSLKVTIKKFYRAGGSSTQSNGVASDIVLPSLLNWADVGESSLSNPMPWDEVTSADLPDLNLVKPYLPELQKRSLSRRATNLDFAYLQEDIAEYRKSLADKSLSINEAVRLGEQSVNEARLEARKIERSTRPKITDKVYEITLKNVDLDGLRPPEVKPKPAASSSDDADRSDAAPTPGEDSAATDAAVMLEARQIMADYISLLKKTPSTAKVP